MKRYNKFIFILFVTAILSGIATSLEAQDKPKKKKTALIEVKGLVTDNTGKPLSGVEQHIKDTNERLLLSVK